MKTFKVVKLTAIWSTSRLARRVEKELELLTDEGWEIVTVAFGTNLFSSPTAYITVSRTSNYV